MSLPRIAIDRPVAVAMFFLGVVFLGLLSFFRLPIDLLPDVAYPRLVVYTTDAGAAPAEVERFITEPVEQAISTVPGVQGVESVTREGASLVTARFAWGTDMDFAALNVRERLDNVRDALPELAARPVVLRTDPRSEPIMALSVSGGRDLPGLKELTESVFKRRLEQIDGVAQAQVTGGSEREIHVHVDPRALESFGLTVDDVAQALKESNASAPGGTILRGRYRYSLRTLGELRGVSEIADVPLRRASAGPGADSTGARVLLRDVARVEDGFRERESLARYNGQEAVGLLVFKNADANTVRVAGQVDQTLAQLRREYPDVAMEVAVSQAGFISDALANVVQEVLLGGIMAFLVLFLFLREARYPVAIALAIPISLIATFAMLHATGVSLNILSLGGMALGVGMLMDNSIVVLENVFRHRELGLRARAAAALGAEEVQRAITASTITTIAVFGPIVYIEGVAGELLGALAMAVAFSLLASIVVAVTLLPALAARWEGDTGRGAGTGRIARFFAPVLDGFDRGFARFAALYERTLASAMRHRARTLAFAVFLLVVGVGVGFLLPRGVLPEVDQGSFRIRVELPEGTPLARTADQTARLERRVRADPAVLAVFTRVGRQVAVAGMDDRQSGLNTAVMDVRLRDGATTAEALERLRPALASFPSGSVAVEAGQATALGRLLGGGEADLAVRVRGQNLDAALAYAGELQRRLAAEPSVTNARLGTELGQPEMRVEIDRERAAAFGIDPRRISQTVESYMKGTVATELVEFDRKVPVVVRLPDEARHSPATLQELRVQGVPLRELVRVHDAAGPSEIRRMDQSRMVTLHADAGPDGVDHAVARIQAVVAAAPPPHGLRVDIGGENEEMRRGFTGLAFAFLLALLLVYMLLAAEFESLLLPFIVLLAVPLAAVGATVALWVTGAGLNTMSLIGMVILVGIVDNDAVVKVDFIIQARKQGMTRHEAIHAAGHARMRPIVMNSITAMLGLLPLALGIGPGGELQAPLAIAVFGGLLSATALTLVVIPVSYDVLDELSERIGAWMGRGPSAEPAPAVPAGLAAGD
ncbi:MAG TPA: efflux RND transporter permease subunit [Longimicrobium sp.]|jgi:HAE1 family hydrophobic/amphiphilic exporter-1|uniref:efflux RND transporter permease subunit n=1 Tax=Longimicrobium sp. TaxID=2029185 RepID=UPI002ED87F1A